MTDRKWSDRLTTLVNLLVVAIAVWFLFRADGPVGSRLAERRERAALARDIQANWADLARGSRRDSGDAARPVVVEFSDYQCPACQEAHFTLAEIARESGVEIVYRHTPNVTKHPMAEGAARAAICAGRQGRFPEMNHRLFSNPDWQTAPRWNELAHEISLPDTAAFRQCFISASVSAEIARDIELARRLRYNGTPTFVGPRGMHLGIPGKEQLARLIQ